jgi:hypothetical protein
LLADVLVGVVGNGVVDETAAVQAFLGVRREAHTHRAPVEKESRALTREKTFAVDHRVQSQAAHGQADREDVANQRTTELSSSVCMCTQLA